ncbi:hypothetical protein RB195_012323 [Necator americanus]
MSDDELVSQRNKLEKEVYALGVVINEYFLTSQLCSSYDEINSTPLVKRVRELGYSSIDEMLTNSGYFTSAVIRSKKHYKAEIKAGNKATQDLSSLVCRQAKKKKHKGTKMNTSSRQYFVRNNFQSHSFHGRTTAFGAGFHRPMFKPFSPKKELEYNALWEENGEPSPTPGPNKGFNLSRSSCIAANQPRNNNDAETWETADSCPRSMMADSYKNGVDSSFLSRRKKDALSSVRSSTSTESSLFSTEDCRNNSRVNSKMVDPASCYSPAAGVHRFITALRSCGGTATADLLRKKYRDLYKVELDKHELKKYFGVTSSRKMVETFLPDLVEITMIRGSGVRCYKLLEMRSELPPRHPPSISELYDRLISIMIEKEPEPVHLDSITNLYSEKYGVKLDPKAEYLMTWKELVLEKFAGSIQLDMRGFIHLNMEDPRLKQMVMKKRVEASLEADIGSDSFDSCNSSLSDLSTEDQDIRTTNSRMTEPKTNDRTAVYVDMSHRSQRKIQEFEDESFERTFDRNLRISRSFHGRSKVTAYYGDEELSDIAGTDAHSERKKPGLRITFSVPSEPNESTTNHQRFATCNASLNEHTSSSSMPKLKTTVPPPLGTFSSGLVQPQTSGARQRLEKTFASVGSFFRRSGVHATTREAEPSASSVRLHSGTVPMDKKVQEKCSRYPGKENLALKAEKDVECAHPYFNVHVKSAAGEARSIAAQKGLVIK